MRDAVRDVIARCEHASLVFDREKLASNAAAIARAASDARVTALFALKSFPQAVRLAEALGGFDVGSTAELTSVLELPSNHIVSIADPSGDAIARAPRDRRVIVATDTIEHVR